MNIKEYFKVDVKNDEYIIQFRLFFNLKSGNHEIVSRSGDIISVIPPVAAFSREDNLILARNILRSFLEVLGCDNDSEHEIIRHVLDTEEVYRLLDLMEYEAGYFDESELPVIEYRPESSITPLKAPSSHVA